MRSFVMLTILLAFALLMPQGSAKDPRAWQTAKIVRAERPNVRGSWNPSFTHWYTIETKSERIRATEMVLAGGWKNRTAIGRKPPMAFKLGEEVQIAFQVLLPGSKRMPDLYILDRDGEEHILTIDEIIPKEKQRN